MQADLRGVETPAARTMVCKYRGRSTGGRRKRKWRDRDDLDERLLLERSGCWGSSTRRPDPAGANAELAGAPGGADDASTSPADFATSGYFEARYQLFDGSGGGACRDLLRIAPGAGAAPTRQVNVWDGHRRETPAR